MRVWVQAVGRGAQWRPPAATRKTSKTRVQRHPHPHARTQRAHGSIKPQTCQPVYSHPMPASYPMYYASLLSCLVSVHVEVCEPDTRPMYAHVASPAHCVLTMLHWHVKGLRTLCLSMYKCVSGWRSAGVHSCRGRCECDVCVREPEVEE